MLPLALAGCATTAKHFDAPAPINYVPVHQSISNLRTSISSAEPIQKELLHLGEVELRVAEVERQNKEQLVKFDILAKHDAYVSDKYEKAVGLLWKTRILYSGIAFVVGAVIGFFFIPLLTLIAKLLGTAAKA